MLWRVLNKLKGRPKVRRVEGERDDLENFRGNSGGTAFLVVRLACAPA